VKIQPEAIETTSVGCDLKLASAPNDAEASLDVCYELVCLGRPWPEILDALQRLKHVSKQRDLDLAAELTDEQVGADQPGEIHPDCSRQIEPRTAHLNQPAGSSPAGRCSPDPPNTFTTCDVADRSHILEQGTLVAPRVEALTLRLPRIVAPLSLIGGICALALLAEATSPIARPSSAPATATIAATFDSAALRPNSAKPAEPYGQRIARTGDVSPMPTAGGGILNTRLLAFGAGGTGAVQRNPAIPEVIRPKPRASAPADIHRRP
jgi:hypothetical protein